MRYSWKIFVGLIFTSCVHVAHTQNVEMTSNDSVYKNASVTWVRQFPSVLNDKNSRKVGDRIIEFIFGKKNNTELTKPVAVLAMDSEISWVLDQENGVIFKFQGEVGEITHFKNKTYKFFRSLVGLCTLPDGTILFTDSYWNKVFSFQATGKYLKPLNDSLVFDRPTGIAYLVGKKQLWVVETNAHRITILDINGHLVRRIGQRGTGPGEFNYPTSIWIDKTNKIFIVDAMNFRIQIFDKEGNFISMFGKIGDATGYFARPKGIATDSYGHVYVADALFNAVQIFDQGGHFLYTFGTQGHGQGEFWMPAGIYIDNKDNIYVTDSYNSRVQVFQLNYRSHQ